MISAELFAAQTELLARQKAHAIEDQTVCRHDAAGWLKSLQHAAATPPIQEEKNQAATTPDVGDSIEVSPDIALAILRDGRAAQGRIWHLLRQLDTLGSGVVSVAEARVRLCDKSAERRCIGWRQLRNVLRDGNGTFWQRDKTHIWLRSRTKVAVALGITRLQYAIVSVPITQCLGGIADYRAMLYASFHTARSDRPISRATLHRLSGVSANSQRAYEGSAHVSAYAQYATVHEGDQDAYWQHGGHVFQIIDHKGVSGKAAAPTLIKQIANCYTSHFGRKMPKRKKRLNRDLSVLLTKGAVGNTKNSIETASFSHLYGIDSNRCNYIRSGQANIWHCMPPQSL